MNRIGFIKKQISVVEDAIDQEMKELRPAINVPYRHILETIPRIDPVPPTAIIGEVGDIIRFPNAKALVAYACLDTTVKANIPVPLQEQ